MHVNIEEGGGMSPWQGEECCFHKSADANQPANLPAMARVPEIPHKNDAMEKFLLMSHVVDCE